MNWMALLVVAAYLGILLLLGWLGYRRSKSREDDYYLAGRGQGWLVSSMTIMATFFSSFALLGAPGMVYREGVVFSLVSLNVPVAGFCIFLLGDRIRRAGHAGGYITQADMLCDYYRSPIVLRLLIALVGVLYVIPYIMMQLKAGGELAAVLFRDSEHAFEVGAVVLSLITALYIMIGGMRSVAWTDALQCLLLTAGMALAGVALVTHFGGLAGLLRRVSELPDRSLTVPGNTGSWRIPMLFSVCLLMPIGGIIQPAQWMRFYAARDSGVLRRGALIFTVVLTGCFIFAIMPVGLGGQVLYPPRVTDSGVLPNEAVGGFDQILLVILRDILPEMFGSTAGETLSALMVVAIMAAAMSTADSNLHALSALLTHDIYHGLLRPSASERERVQIGRMVILSATLLSLILVLWGNQPGSGLFGFMRMIVGLALFAVAFSVQLLPMTIDMLFFRWATKQAVIGGLVVGLGVAFCFTTLLEPLILLLGFSEEALLLRLVAAAKSIAPVDASAWGLAANTGTCIALTVVGRRGLSFRAAGHSPPGEVGSGV